MQTIQVKTLENRCIVTFERWQAAGFCGRNGATQQKTEGDGKTPLGCFAIRFGFYGKFCPPTRLPMVKLHPLHRWIDDPASPCYNKLLFGQTNTRGEILVDHPAEYALGLVAEYNRDPPIAPKGSAIFLHCGHASTAGCIAVPYPFLYRVVTQLNPSRQPCIKVF